VRRVLAALGSGLFFLLAPGVVAGVVPWLLTGWEAQGPSGFLTVARPAGLLVAVAGLAVLLHAFVRFVTEGIGTPAPVAPTDRLVVGGLYRHVRNPMYVAVVSTIVGQALVFGSPLLLAYATAVWAAMAAFVRWYEEPTLHRQFGAAYDAYRAAVPAWWPRLRPWDLTG
jgi:protein-S-isoprenylcysteine O-methyltransferase Ste14